MIENVLTLNPIKEFVYRRDVSFTQAIGITLDVWPDTRSLISFLWDHAAILLRPEAIVARRSCSILAMLRVHGLVPVAVRRIHMLPEQGRLLWRYQANVMTRGHFSLLQRLLAAGPSIYIVLKDRSERRSTPAAGHVTYLKGPTLMTKRRPLHLRSLAGPAIANILSYVHASDDPADFLRELAVLFPEETFVDILREASAEQDRTWNALAMIGEAELYAPKGVLDVKGMDAEREGDSSREDLKIWQDWIEIVERAQRNVSFVGGEVYETRAALVPDDKRYLARLDNHLVFADFGPAF